MSWRDLATILSGAGTGLMHGLIKQQESENELHNKLTELSLAQKLKQQYPDPGDIAQLLVLEKLMPDLDLSSFGPTMNSILSGGAGTTGTGNAGHTGGSSGGSGGSPGGSPGWSPGGDIPIGNVNNWKIAAGKVPDAYPLENGMQVPGFVGRLFPGLNPKAVTTPSGQVLTPNMDTPPRFQTDGPVALPGVDTASGKIPFLNNLGGGLGGSPGVTTGQTKGGLSIGGLTVGQEVVDPVLEAAKRREELTTDFGKKSIDAYFNQIKEQGARLPEGSVQLLSNAAAGYALAEDVRDRLRNGESLIGASFTNRVLQAKKDHLRQLYVLTISGKQTNPQERADLAVTAGNQFDQLFNPLDGKEDTIKKMGDIAAALKTEGIGIDTEQRFNETLKTFRKAQSEFSKTPEAKAVDPLQAQHDALGKKIQDLEGRLRQLTGAP